MIPVLTRASPIGVTENREKEAIFLSVGKLSFVVEIRSFKRIKGEDPTIVIVPPNIAQKPIGIKSRERGMSVRLEILETTGMYKAAAPTFCIKLEITPTELEIIGIIRFSETPAHDADFSGG